LLKERCGSGKSVRVFFKELSGNVKNRRGFINSLRVFTKWIRVLVEYLVESLKTL